MLLVFISHSSADRQFVEGELIPLLKLHGLPCWYSPVDIQMASDWETSIRKALIEAEWFVVVLSPSSVSSEWVKTEVHWALENRKDHVVPVVISDCNPGDLHLKLQRIQYIDYRNTLTAARQRLVEALGGVWVDNAEEEPCARRGSDTPAATASQTAGSIVQDLAKYGGYEVISTLARTGLGLVFLARHPRLGIQVVVKTYELPFLSPSELTELVNRVKERARLVHPTVVSIQEVFSVGGYLHIVMEHVLGAVNVWERNQRAPFTAEDATAALTQVATGLSYAHHFGIVHGAIDPSSVLIAPDGRTKLSGFDRTPIGKACEDHLLQGTLRYVAPEQLVGRPCSKQSDVWLLGVVLYEMLMGEAPFFNQHEILSYMGKVSLSGWEKKSLSYANHVPKRLRALCERCLKVEEAARYSDAFEVLRALRSPDSRRGFFERLTGL